MNINQAINEIVDRLNINQSTDIDCNINGTMYKTRVLCPDENRQINIPSIVMIPKMPSSKINNMICMESNNLQTDNMAHMVGQGIDIAIKLTKVTNNAPCPIVIPLIPNEKDKPYYQQLSKECFDLQRTDPNYRMDEQIVRIIEQVKSILNDEFKVKAKDKIFLSGYSSSGVFAQRFALLHPEIVDTVCIGGASGSIPIPSNKIGYPIGIEDYEIITGEKFNIINYSQIMFRYYVGELEANNKATNRFDENGNPAPMHDMSYFKISVPTDVGKLQRELLGRDLFERSKITVELLSKYGFDITQTIFEGRSHNDNSGHGVNELGHNYIRYIYDKTVEKQINGEENEISIGD